ncbi:amidase [Yinghuangia aomiensis]|uniref:Amidase n=1 Tax=Yinghuangia aomiensis TaxID=676205 RepID=A0ABP9I411_9ACTN
MDTEALLDTNDAVGLAALVRDRQVSAYELLDAVSARIEARNPIVNAFVATRIDLARAEIAAGLPDGPLCGVPFAVKDIACDIAGLPTTAGSRLFADALAADDGVLATRYRRAGLVLVGKTNAPELGKNASTEPLLHGPTRNPWRLTHSAGGSSGGSAAAVAAGMVPAAHANDGGGSTRIPAGCCGLFGLKPSRGRVPDDRGLWAFAFPVAAHHAVTRSVRDSAALLDAVVGPVPGDPYAALPIPSAGSFLSALAEPPVRLRIAMSTQAPGGGAVPTDLVRAVEHTAVRLMDLGHHVEEAAPTWDAGMVARASAIVMAASARAQIEDRLAVLGRELADDDVEPFTRFLYDTFRNTTAADMHRALKDVERAGRQVAPFFDTYDIWLTPTMAMHTPFLGVLDTTNPATMGEHGPNATRFTQIFNTTGLPAASIPAGMDSRGMPVGVQIGGRMGAEAVLLRLAAQLEEAAPWPWQPVWPPAGT